MKRSSHHCKQPMQCRHFMALMLLASLLAVYPLLNNIDADKPTKQYKLSIVNQHAAVDRDSPVDTDCRRRYEVCRCHAGLLRMVCVLIACCVTVFLQCLSDARNWQDTAAKQHSAFLQTASSRLPTVQVGQSGDNWYLKLSHLLAMLCRSQPLFCRPQLAIIASETAFSQAIANALPHACLTTLCWTRRIALQCVTSFNKQSSCKAAASLGSHAAQMCLIPTRLVCNRLVHLSLSAH